MPVDRVHPDPHRALAKLSKQVAKLEKRLSQVIDARREPFVISFAGLPEEDVESPPWRPIYPTEIDLIVPQVLTAPSGSDMTIDLKVNGTLARTLTILDGDTYSEDAVPFVIPMGQVLTATVTAASGAEDLAIHLVPRLL